MHGLYEIADEKVREILRAMTPEQKLDAAMQLYWSARETEAGYFRSNHPEWSEEQVKRAVREAFTKGEDC